jgi:hypothetical protein
MSEGDGNLSSGAGAGDEAETLGELLRRIGEAADAGEESISLATIIDGLGPRSYGSALLLAGLVTVAPLIGDIPGVPTLMAVVVVLTAGQMLVRRQGLWLPQWLENRSVSAERTRKAVRGLEKPARMVDRLLRPRLTGLVRGAGRAAVAAACLLIGLALPPMELIPFSATVAGAALTGFGLSLIAADGLVALLSFTFTAAVTALVLSQLI